MEVADHISRECAVLCLDEFFVTDVADASILSRLFGRLFENGLVLVATSNRKPDALYEGGLQRDLFLPFIEKLKVIVAVGNCSERESRAACSLSLRFKADAGARHALAAADSCSAVAAQPT